MGTLNGAENLAWDLRSLVRRKIFWGCFFSVGALYAFAVGSVVVLCRLLWGAEVDWVWPALPATVGVAVVHAAAVALRKSPQLARLTVFLDSLDGGQGGFIASAAECDLAAWHNAVTLPPLPRVSLRGGLKVWPFVTGMLFLVCAVFFPIDQAGLLRQARLDITRESETLSNKLDVVAEEKILPDKEVAGMAKLLDNLESGSDAAQADRTYELLDAMNRKIDEAGEKKAGETRENLQAVDMLGKVSDMLNAMADSAEKSAAQNEFSELMRQLSAVNPEIADMMRRAASGTAGKKNGKDGKMSAAEQRKMREEMQSAVKKWRNRLNRLQSAQIIRRQCTRPGKCNGKNGDCNNSCGNSESIEQWLKRNADWAENLSCANCGAGKGGVSRGRGDADLNFANQTPEHRGGKKELGVIAPLDNDDSILLDRFAGAPDGADKERKDAVAGKLQGADGKIKANNSTILPVHRRAVEEYFKK